MLKSKFQSQSHYVGLHWHILLFGQSLLVYSLVKDWQNDICIYTTFHIWVSIMSDIMYLSFDMIPQGTTMQILESKSIWGTRLLHITIWSKFASANASKRLAKWYFYIHYLSYIGIYDWWCNASILWYDTSRDYQTSISKKAIPGDLIDTY